MKNNTPKLTIELIPKTCHFSNVRTMVSRKEWNKLRFTSYKLANDKCEICGDNGLNQGYKHRVECHEVWEYNDKNNIQKLIKLVSLCVNCHQVKHIGRAIAIGKQKEAFNQLMKVNKWSMDEVLKHVEEAFQTYKERSKFEWVLDISILKEEPYSLSIVTGKKRIFERKRFKRKKKKPLRKNGKRPPKKKS